MRALIMVDIQNDFLPGGPLAVPEGDEVIPVANKLVPRFETVVTTRDWHPPDHCSFAKNHPGYEPGEKLEIEGLEQVLWPVHCVQDSAGAQFAETLDTSSVDCVISKGKDPRVDSYSGFFSNGRRHDTGLHDFLQQRSVQDVFIVGLATNVCVHATALDAVSLGYHTTVVDDGVRGIDLQEGDVQRARDEMKQAGVEFVQSRDIIASDG